MSILKPSACPLHPALWVVATLLLVFVSSALTFAVTVAGFPSSVVCTIPAETIQETDNG